MSDEKKCPICDCQLDEYYKFNYGPVGDVCKHCFGKPYLFIIGQLLSRIEQLEQCLGEMQNALATDNRRLEKLEQKESTA